MPPQDANPTPSFGGFGLKMRAGVVSAKAGVGLRRHQGCAIIGRAPRLIQKVTPSRRHHMSNVPMTRPNEALAVHPPTSMAPNTFVELRDGRILGAAHFGDSGSSIFPIFPRWNPVLS